MRGVTEVMYPLLYNFVGSSKREETETEQPVSLVASRPTSHVVLKEALPGSEESVRRLVVQFQCKSEGESIVALDFSFHGYRDIQIFMKKKCAAPASASLRDPSCSSGILSNDGTGCCAASCGTCGGDGCEDREGGLVGCCLTHIVSSALPCTITTAPCIMGAHQSKVMKELQSNLPLPDENTNQHFSFLLVPLWLIGAGLALIKLIIWCMAAGAILIYVFTVCYGLYALKDPFLVAAAPSATQLFNAVCLIGGHVCYLYKIHSSTVFGGDAFHSYTPFEERAQVKPSKLSNKDNPFRPPVTWRSNDDNGSFIRLTSFKAKPADEPETHPSEGLRPMEFCDMEADGHHVGDGESGIDDNLWEGPQGDFQADSWVDDTTSTFSRLSEQGFPTQQASQHYRNLPSSQYEPF